VERAEAFERRLSPTSERVALAVALELEVGVFLQRVVRAEKVYLHRVVDHELDGLQRVDAARVAAISAIASRIAARSTTHGTP